MPLCYLDEPCLRDCLKLCGLRVEVPVNSPVLSNLLTAFDGSSGLENEVEDTTAAVPMVDKQGRHTRYDHYDHGRTTFRPGWSTQFIQKSNKKIQGSSDLSKTSQLSLQGAYLVQTRCLAASTPRLQAAIHCDRPLESRVQTTR